ncbi:PA14 domain-containing protein [Emticicia sp. 21SJ11W-3]|uniref:PA14 domain-containing protein n=1 Tax=Emticicia sp. 21SJ11W-3 TaxID=2916755 RepID=UPI0020A1E29B|nr:PA14 domain-containing protein [Emticicia sp. 21SJ11W-3]UTA69106.1 PA14 domain-containing protein [Emticicia sp. 21SJ11W-3]
MYLRFLSILWASLLCFQSYAQEFPLNQLPIDNWETGSWKTAGSVDNPYKKKPGFKAGNQILFSTTPGRTTSKLITADAKVKFDFMLGKNSDGVFYIQGKHGIILSNSGTTGAIIRPDGTLQLANQNAGKAIGLWQTLEVTFSDAPFGEALIIEKVTLNNVVIHQGYVIPAKGINEGPLAFENKAGTIAIKNVQYLKYNKEKPLKLSDLSYEMYETFDWNQQFAPKSTTPNDKGTTTALTKDFGAGYNRFLLIFRGNLDVEKDGSYSLVADYAGKASVKVDGKEVIPTESGETYRRPRAAYLDLKKGKHPIEIRYNKVWWRAELGLFAAGPEVRAYPLHAETSLPSPQAVGEIEITPRSDVEVIRSFVMFNGKKRTHAISVGTPAGTHYTFDLDQGTPLYAWRGDFADVTEMFHERGEPQLLKPKGVKTTFSGKTSVAMLANANESFPDTLDDYKDFIFKGYALGGEGLPTYKYQYKGAEITEKFEPSADGGITTTISAFGGNSLYARLGEAKSITQLDKGFYILETTNGNDSYIRLDAKLKPVIKNTRDGQEIIIPLAGSVSFTTLW